MTGRSSTSPPPTTIPGTGRQEHRRPPFGPDHWPRWASVRRLGPEELSRGNRFTVLTGLVLGLMPSAFLVMLLVILGG